MSEAAPRAPTTGHDECAGRRVESQHSMRSGLTPGGGREL